MENDRGPEEHPCAASKRATDARKLAESLEERAEDMHRAAAAAQSSVAQFAEMVREHEPDIAKKLDVDPERYRRRAASEMARADQAQQRRENDIRERAADSEEPADTGDTRDTENTTEAGDAEAPADAAQTSDTDEEKDGSTAG
ncbi:MAG: hypothetical protein ACRDO0_14550 [Nocardioidaceae bacterium]